MNKISFLRITHDLRHEQIFGGQAVISKLKGIAPHYDKYNPLSQSIDFEATESNLKTLFYDIWAAVGDDLLKEWMAAEGFKVEGITK